MKNRSNEEPIQQKKRSTEKWIAIEWADGAFWMAIVVAEKIDSQRKEIERETGGQKEKERGGGERKERLKSIYFFKLENQIPL